MPRGNSGVAGAESLILRGFAGIFRENGVVLKKNRDGLIFDLMEMG